jgi:hypothetical protein
MHSRYDDYWSIEADFLPFLTSCFSIVLFCLERMPLLVKVFFRLSRRGLRQPDFCLKSRACEDTASTVDILGEGWPPWWIDVHAPLKAKDIKHIHPFTFSSWK